MADDKPDLTAARRYSHLKFNKPRPGVGSRDSGHAIAVAIDVVAGRHKPSADEIMEAFKFTAGAGVEGVSHTHHRDEVEKKRNETICAIRDLKSIEKNFSKYADENDPISKWLAVAIRQQETAQQRGRQAPPHENTEVRRLVELLYELEAELIEMGTRTRDPHDRDQSLLLRAGALCTHMRSRKNPLKPAT